MPARFVSGNMQVHHRNVHQQWCVIKDEQKNIVARVKRCEGTFECPICNFANFENSSCLFRHFWNCKTKQIVNNDRGEIINISSTEAD